MTEEPGVLQSMGSHRVGHNEATENSSSNNTYVWVNKLSIMSDISVIDALEKC